MRQKARQSLVIPAKAGIQHKSHRPHDEEFCCFSLDTGFRPYDALGFSARQKQRDADEQ